MSANRIFFGSLKSDINMVDGNIQTTQTQEERFAQIVCCRLFCCCVPFVDVLVFLDQLLDIEHTGTLAESLDQFTAATPLEDYKVTRFTVFPFITYLTNTVQWQSPQGQTIPATKQYWFSSLPDMLMLQLHRVKYSKEVFHIL